MIVCESTPPRAKTLSRLILMVAVVLLTQSTGLPFARADSLNGTYALKAANIQTKFSVRIIGSSPLTGTFKTVGGKMTLDAQRPQNSRVNVVVDLVSVETDNAKVTGFLKSSAMFDVANYPKATFQSTRVRLTGDRSAEVEGMLTLRGLKQRTNLTVSLIDGKRAGEVDFKVDGGFFRSLFGMELGQPIYGDLVRLVITGSARRG